MSKIRITKRAIDTLLGAPAGTVIRDDRLVGFQARRNANGTVSYAFEYRSSKGRGGATRRVTIGREREAVAFLRQTKRALLRNSSRLKSLPAATQPPAGQRRGKRRR